MQKPTVAVEGVDCPRFRQGPIALLAIWRSDAPYRTRNHEEFTACEESRNRQLRLFNPQIFEFFWVNGLELMLINHPGTKIPAQDGFIFIWRFVLNGLFVF